MTTITQYDSPWKEALEAYFPDFLRMYTYNYRIFDRYAREVISLAVLGDEVASWRPAHFGYERWGYRLAFEFPSVKLLDYRQDWAVLEESMNPFAMVIMAHLKTQETAGAMQERAAVKWDLIRRLYERGYTRQDILTLFRFIDWLLALPPELEQLLWQEIQEYEEAQNMTYVTSVERIGIQKGMQQGRLARGREAILNVLEARFITVPLALTRRINALENDALLRRLHRQAVLVPTVEDFTRLLDEAWAECVAEEARETPGV